MPLDRFVLILFLVIAAAGATVWLGALLVATLPIHPGAAVAALIPTALAAYVLWRVVAQRLGSREDDHYDRIGR